MKIERLGPEDWERYKTLRLAALRDTPDAFGSTYEREAPQEKEGWQARLSKAGVVTFAATQGQSDIGLVVGARTGKGAGLFSMWVAADHRRSGAGRALVHAVITWARDEGCSYLVLEVADENEAAVSFYDSLGFWATGRTSTMSPPRTHIKEHERMLLLM